MGWEEGHVEVYLSGEKRRLRRPDWERHRGGWQMDAVRAWAVPFDGFVLGC